MIESRCGLLCKSCTFKQSHGCGGCIETNGHPFHGECPVAICAQDKGFAHCGECPEIPCQQLTAYSFDPVHGDNGGRIAVCKRWVSESE